MRPQPEPAMRISRSIICTRRARALPWSVTSRRRSASFVVRKNADEMMPTTIPESTRAMSSSISVNPRAGLRAGVRVFTINLPTAG
jgi:hypothetical protein